MRTASAIRTGLVLAVAVALGLMVAPAARALWSVFVPTNAGTIQAADFSVLLTGSPLSSTQEMVLNDGRPATLSLTGSGFELAKLYPGASATAGVQVANTTNADSDFTISVTIPKPATTSANLAGQLTLKYAPAASFTECATLDIAMYKDREYFSMDVTKGGSAVMCIQIGLLSSAPSTLSGQSVSISVPLQANQQ